MNDAHSNIKHTLHMKYHVGSHTLSCTFFFFQTVLFNLKLNIKKNTFNEINDM